MKDNKLIAEFMELEVDNGLYCYTTAMDDYKTDTLYFDSSWDWLMPVVDKIESFEDDNRCCKYNVKIEQCWSEIIDNKTSDRIVLVDADDKKLSTFKAIVVFIKRIKKNT